MNDKEQIAALRQKFEKSQQFENDFLEMRNEEYANPFVQSAWEGFQQGYALSTVPAQSEAGEWRETALAAVKEYAAEKRNELSREERSLQYEALSVNCAKQEAYQDIENLIDAITLQSTKGESDEQG